MEQEKEIEAFLQDFKIKMKIWGIVFRDDRGKNLQTLLDLDIIPATRIKIISELTRSDYHKGPVPDTLNGGSDLWVFKKTVKGFQVYIKITLGACNNSTICISFHI